MKHNIILVGILLFAAFTCSHAQYRTKDTTFVNDYYATSTADTNYVAKKGAVTDTVLSTRFVIIQNQSTTTGDTLWFWFNNDSTKSKKHLLPGQRYQRPKLIKSINTRSGSSNSIRRPIDVEVP